MLFAFYDFETTGVSPAFDQPLQFAAILTDDDFKEIKSVDIRCRLSDHILPSPIALAVTKVSPDLILNQERSLYAFAQELAELITDWSPAIWIGYNTLDFDEKVFRQLFYQNLIPNIYRTQMDGNLRLDVLKHSIACWAYGSDALKFPISPNGKRTLKLDQLAPLNGFADHAAHDALGDVRATIHVASLVRNKAPDLWKQTIQNLDRGRLLKDLQSGRPYHLVERFGGHPPKIYTGVYCGMNAEKDKQIGFVDLNGKNIVGLLGADEALIEKAVSASTKLIRSVDLGSMPLLFPAKDIPADLQQLAEQFANQNDLWAVVGKKLAARFSDSEAPTEIEDRIYEKFYDRADEKKLYQFHKVPWAERSAILNEISDDRLRELGNRLLTLYAPEFADAAFKKAFWGKMAMRWNGDEFYGDDEKNAGNTYKSVAAALADLEKGERFKLGPELISEFKVFFENRKLALNIT